MILLWHPVMQFMCSESEQLSVLAHANDPFIRTEQVNRLWKPKWPTVHCQMIPYIGLFNFWHKSHFLPPRFSWKQLNEKVSQSEDGKYFVETDVAQSTEMEDRRIPDLYWVRNIKYIKFTFSSGLLFYYLINGLQYFTIIVNNTHI